MDINEFSKGFDHGMAKTIGWLQAWYRLKELVGHEEHKGGKFGGEKNVA